MYYFTVLVESLSPRFALFLVTALMLEQPVLLVVAPGNDEILMHAGEYTAVPLGGNDRVERLASIGAVVESCVVWEAIPLKRNRYCRRDYTRTRSSYLSFHGMDQFMPVDPFRG